MQTTTKQMILDRVNRKTAETVVPERAIKFIDKVMEDNAADSPTDYWERVEFFKEKVLEDTLPQFKGLMAVAFHQYMAALYRDENPEFESDADEFGSRPYNLYAEAIAQRDAYLACCASLD